MADEEVVTPEVTPEVESEVTASEDVGQVSSDTVTATE
jgi:hypothetical protein